jgi:hypothetical protein
MWHTDRTDGLDPKQTVSIMADTDDTREPLHWFERTFVTTVGVSAVGAGAYAIFASSNQWGTAALIVAGAVMTLIGIQGTPLLRFSNSSTTVELASKRTKLESEVKEAQAQGDVSKAAGLAQGALIAEPRLMRPEYRGLIYEQNVNLALLRLGYRTALQTVDRGYDLQVFDSDDHLIGVELKSLARPISAQVIQSLNARYANSSVPVLLVTSTLLTQSGKLVAARDNIDHVMWRDENDDLQLDAKLQEIFSRISNDS